MIDPKDFSIKRRGKVFAIYKDKRLVGTMPTKKSAKALLEEVQTDGFKHV